MTKEQKLLSEIISYLTNTSNVLESIRGPLSKIDKVSFFRAQEHLTESIRQLKNGKQSVDKRIEESEGA